MLYLRLDFKKHRQHYYQLLSYMRLTVDWEAWLEFFAVVSIATAARAVETARQFLDLADRDRDKIGGLGRAAELRCALPQRIERPDHNRRNANDLCST